MKANLDQSIQIAQGLGVIKFGFTTEDMQRYLGTPDEVETLDPGTDSAVMWYYVGQKLQIIFQKSATDGAMSITQLTTSHPTATLWGTRIIGRPENEVLALFKAHGREEFTEWEESPDAPSYKSFRMENLRVTLDFRNGLLQRVLWGSLDVSGGAKVA